MIWVGIDTGGTFTDLVAYDDVTRQFKALKTPSTPGDPSRGVLAAVEETGYILSEIGEFSHGTTVATNTALEHKGAKLGVLTTRGHRDVLIVGRGNRTQVYDITATRPQGIVERRNVIEIDERCSFEGDVLTPLNPEEVEAACETLRNSGVEAIAICFLHSYANPDHEQAALAVVRRQLPNVLVSASHEILPEYREFERFSTTALNAYVAPRTANYLERLATDMAAKGLSAPVRVMASNGGTWPASRMAERPANALLSGPAGGVIAAQALSESLGFSDIITYDMGGTSTDACLIRDGQFAMNSEGMVGWYPNRVPQIDINTVGAGGGSIAYLESGDFLNVGPRSAGAEPGPACYGKGGSEPTVTDANVVLGRFRPMDAIGGSIAIDEEAARLAVGSLADRLDISIEAMAEGIIHLAVIRMTASVKEISVMKGIDPRDFTLVAFGGAGPLHAPFIAEELGIKRIVVPPLPGNFSAFGLMVADTRHDVARTTLLPLEDAELGDVHAKLAPLEAEARLRLKTDGYEPQNTRIEASLDMRYVGQAFELTIPFASDIASLEDLLELFHDTYEQRYSHSDRGAAEIVAFRVAGFGEMERPGFPDIETTGDLEVSRRPNRDVVFKENRVRTDVYWRDQLPPGTVITGPAIIEEAGSTSLIPPGFTSTVHISGSLILQREEDQ